jgi:hypothetical protein
MHAERGSPRRASFDPVLAAGMLVWVAALAALWPASLSFGDEVGYVGQARLFLQGRIHPLPYSPGVWLNTTHGLIPKFPLLMPLLLTPFLAISPSLLFASGVLAALAMAWVMSRALMAWGRSPRWALLVLAHPSIVLIARTVMADLVLSALAVSAWWALRSRKSAMAATLLMLVVGIKPTGILIALALSTGEWVRSRGDRSAARSLAWGAAGMVAGVIVTAILNLVACGHLWFGYGDALATLGIPTWSPRYLLSSAPTYLTSLLLLPPLLLPAGVWVLWRRREHGPLLVVLGLTGMMCMYLFVDTGRSRIETLVLAPRLLLPVFGFLILGYADGLASVADRLPRLAPGFAGGLVLLPAVVAVSVSMPHHRWQKSGAAALSAATDRIASLGGGRLGLTYEATKAGLLYGGETAMVSKNLPQPPSVALCSTRDPSYRASFRLAHCDLAGYQEDAAFSDFHVLVRRTARP